MEIRWSKSPASGRIPGIHNLAKVGQGTVSPEDLLKEPLVPEFLGPDEPSYLHDREEKLPEETTTTDLLLCNSVKKVIAGSVQM